MKKRSFLILLLACCCLVNQSFAAYPKLNEANHKFIDEEIYDIMQKFNNDEELIKNELKERLKDFLKGDEFDWVEIGESE